LSVAQESSSFLKKRSKKLLKIFIIPLSAGSKSFFAAFVTRKERA
jgi:hypothetical protein